MLAVGRVENRVGRRHVRVAAERGHAVEHQRAREELEDADPVVGGGRPDELAGGTVATEVLPPRREPDAIARRHAQAVGQVARQRVCVPAQELDLRADADLRRREAARQRRRIEYLVRARRTLAAPVVRVDARVVVEVRSDLARVGEHEPTGLDHRLHERDVAAHVLRAAFVDEDLRERVDVVVERGEARPGLAGALRVEPACELIGVHQVRSHDRRAIRGRADGRGARGHSHAAATASSALTTKAMSERGRGVRARSIRSFIDSEIQSTRIRDRSRAAFHESARRDPGREAATRAGEPAKPDANYGVSVR